MLFSWMPAGITTRFAGPKTYSEVSEAKGINWVAELNPFASPWVGEEGLTAALKWIVYSFISRSKRVWGFFPDPPPFS